MPDINCKPGWAGAIQLKVGAAQIDIPVLRGAYQRFDGRQVEILAQGAAANAYPINSSKSPDSSVLNLTARAFTSWFTAANLNSLFVTRNANGATGSLDWKVNNGVDAAVDSGKGSALRIACSAAQGPLSVDMSFLGMANGSAATSRPRRPRPDSRFFTTAFRSVGRRLAAPPWPSASSRILP